MPAASRRRVGPRAGARRGRAQPRRRTGRRARPATSGGGRCGSGRAFAADPDDRGMREVGAEALLRLKAPGERLEQPERDLLLRAAAAADQMSVTLDVRAMPARHPVVEVGVRDVAELLEGLEVA